MLGASAGALSATVYKWVDDNGITHYSDQPNPKAEKLEISGAQTYGSKAAAVTAPASTAAATTRSPAVCTIDTPGTGAVLIDTYAIAGHVTIANAGGASSQLTLRLDGTDISALLEPNGSFTVPDVDRGDHTLTLQVSNSQGEVICQGAAVTFSIRQRSAGTNTVPMAPTAPAAPRAPSVAHQ